MTERILVADDDPTILRLVVMLLELEGYEVGTASNGREALDQVGAFRPDLLVCDVMMPHLNGLEVVARLRKDEETSSLPIVMLSAKAQEIDIQHGKGVGADEYVTKPFEPDMLVATVRRVLDGKAKPRPAAKAPKRSGTTARKAKGASKKPGSGAARGKPRK